MINESTGTELNVRSNMTQWLNYKNLFDPIKHKPLEGGGGSKTINYSI